MIQLITLILVFATLFFSKRLFGRSFNHLNIYAIVWGVVVILYEVRLLKYIDISAFTWLIILYAFVAYVLGTVTIFLARFNYKPKIIRFESLPPLLLNDGKYLYSLILIFTFVGLFSALQHWSLLIHKFGSIQSIFIQADAVYRLNVENKMPGVIPYIHIASYLAVFFSGVYTAYKNRITFVAILSLAAVILKDLAIFGRSGILVGFLLFLTSFMLFKYYIENSAWKHKIKTSSRNTVIAGIVIAILFLAGISTVKSFRGKSDSFKATSQSFKQYNDNFLISPSVYLYASSHIGVLNKYFEEDNESASVGENSLMPIYNFLSRYDIVKHPNFFQKGYLIPMWTNTGTYLREVHADYGDVGLLLFPYLLGMLCTYFWFRFYETGKMISFLILVYLYLIVGLSFFVIITRTATWFLSFASLLIAIPIIEHFTMWINERRRNA